MTETDLLHLDAEYFSHNSNLRECRGFQKRTDGSTSRSLKPQMKVMDNTFVEPEQMNNTIEMADVG